MHKSTSSESQNKRFFKQKEIKVIFRLSFAFRTIQCGMYGKVVDIVKENKNIDNLQSYKMERFFSYIDKTIKTENKYRILIEI